jgi:hypothetical protein
MMVRFDAIGMIVSDMANTLAFYRMLGLDIPDENPVDLLAVLPAGS